MLPFSMSIQNIQNMSCLKWIACSIENSENTLCEKQAFNWNIGHEFCILYMKKGKV